MHPGRLSFDRPRVGVGVVVVVVVVVFTFKTIMVSLSSTSFCPNLSVLIQHLTRPISVVTD